MGPILPQTKATRLQLNELPPCDMTEDRKMSNERNCAAAELKKLSKMKVLKQWFC